MAFEHRNQHRAPQSLCGMLLAALVLLEGTSHGLAQTCQKPPQAVLDVLSAPVPRRPR